MSWGSPIAVGRCSGPWRPAPRRAAAAAGLALALLGSSAGAEVRVERLPDGTRMVRNLPAVQAPVRSAPAASAAAPAHAAAAPSRPVTPPAELRRLVAEAAAREGIDRRLVEAVVRAESAWNPAALSVKGAMGLMQLMPATAAELTVADPWDAAENVRGGVRYLRGLLDRFDRLEHAVAAYNAGPAAVERHGGVPPYAETRAYVRRVLALYGRQGDLGAALGVRGASPRLVQAADGRRLLTNTPSSTGTTDAFRAVVAAAPAPAAAADGRIAAAAPPAGGAQAAASIVATVAAN